VSVRARGTLPPSVARLLEELRRRLEAVETELREAEQLVEKQLEKLEEVRGA
jgi:hypothetical protein